MKPLSNIRSVFELRTRFALWTGIFLLLVVLVYGYSRVQAFLSGPSLDISYPASVATVHDSLLTILGHAANLDSLTLNGSTIHTDEAGYFKEKLLLPHGSSILELIATDRFNRKTKKTLSLVYK